MQKRVALGKAAPQAEHPLARARLAVGAVEDGTAIGDARARENMRGRIDRASGFQQMRGDRTM